MQLYPFTGKIPIIAIILFYFMGIYLKKYGRVRYKTTITSGGHLQGHKT